MSQQQTLLRVYSNSLNNQGNTYPYEYLDTYSSIPIKINKSIAELQDIATRNSSYSVGLLLPGSKKNNRFFENFFNVDAQSLFFNAIKRVNCDVLLEDQSYFTGYMRLNKVSVMDSKVEYDVTLYSSVGDLFGKIGNNLMRDLNFTDSEYTFNHVFTQSGVTSTFDYSNFNLNQEHPYSYFYPIVQNGYNYDAAGIPNLSGTTSGSTLENQTRIYTSTSPIGSYTGTTQAYAAGVKEYYINSPIYGLRDNQLKPALSIYSLIKLMFKQYGYSIQSDFFNTPWFKTLYLYGYYSSELTKFSYKINSIQQLPLDGVEVYNTGLQAIVVKKGSGIPCYCLDDINVTISWSSPSYHNETATILAGTTGYTYTGCCGFDLFQASVPTADNLTYYPLPVGTVHTYVDGDYVDFSLVFDQNIKQIDILSSIAKKFDLVFIPDTTNPNVIKIEPYDYYMGTGIIYDWTPKMSWDKGFTVEPALNYIESNLNLTDLEDGDEGNRIFKNQTNRIYGQNFVYNPTDFKSQEKKIETVFSPELVRSWDSNISLPLGINYAAANETDSFGQVRWSYTGVKTKPKLFYWLGGQNPFLNTVNQVYPITNNYNTYTVKIAPSNYTGTSSNSYSVIPVISHTMPMGLSDQNKINNDSISILFNSELPVNVGIQTYNTYTEQDMYQMFYQNRITNLYNPNTRFISGYFNLKYSDIQNLNWNDIIKINEQYFTINKVIDYNLTNRELTKVELIQTNVSPQVYPTRYFSYYYCDNPSMCYRIKTDFTNPNLLNTNYAWSIYYDHQVGSLTGSTTGFTSTLYNNNTITSRVEYTPYTMMEITKDQYYNGGCSDSSCDTLMTHIINTESDKLLFKPFWVSSGYTGTNVWASCSAFNTAKTAYGIVTQSSTYYGYNSCLPTPTPTVTPTLTPTPTATPTITPTPTVTPTPAPYSCYLFNGPILDMVLDSQNRWIFTGGFSSYSGNTANNKIAFTTGLTINNTFDRYSGSPIDNSYSFINETSNGSFIVGTSINQLYPGSYPPIWTTNFYKLTSGGTIDTSFTTISGNTDNLPYAINMKVSKNKDIIWVGWDTATPTFYNGSFSLYKISGGTSIGDFSAFPPLGGMDMVNSDGSLICSYNSNITKLNLSLSSGIVTGYYVDTTFNSNISSYSHLYSDIIVDQVNNKFYTIDATSSPNYIRKFNLDGTLDTGFTFTGITISGNTFIPDGKLGSTVIDNNGRLLVHVYCYGITDRYLIKLNTDGTLYNTFKIGKFNQILPYCSMQVLPDNSIAVTINGYTYPINSTSISYISNSITYNRFAMIIVNDDGSVKSCV